MAASPDTHIGGLNKRVQMLDALRGIAALQVYFGHLRDFVFVNFGRLSTTNIGLKAFYAVTGLGHEAVIIFFALSGYLVGGKAVMQMQNRSWQLQRYMLRRLTRLWIVLLPALIATVIFDYLGLRMGGKGYGGEYYSLYFSGPDKFTNHHLITLIGNIFFLQGISVPIFGTNGPMWSLANEFWYYILFPLAASAFFFRHRPFYSLLASIISVALLVYLPHWLILLGIIWLAGAMSAWAAEQGGFVRHFRSWTYRLGALLALCSLVLARIYSNAYFDIIFGVVVAGCLPALVHLPETQSVVYSRTTRGLSEISYTLYLTHFPLFAFLFFTAITPQRWYPGYQGAMIYLAIAVLGLAWAFAMWWCFERNTHRVFRFLALHLRVTKSPQSKAAITPAEMN
jgi:peptidoglycan/LPS O-acetylase OafA/YrhL